MDLSRQNYFLPNSLKHSLNKSRAMAFVLLMIIACVVGIHTLYASKLYVKILGLDICADTLVGDEMLKGISGGQKKRLTTGSYSYLL